mmetsp:Transcript_92263/g.192960  ORF Transcript_92263/g.192960 Transcript_92263/m.192960 type:complete len:408 (-) Transcript_92263:2384-3607(-)
MLFGPLLELILRWEGFLFCYELPDQEVSGIVVIEVLIGSLWRNMAEDDLGQVALDSLYFQNDRFVFDACGCLSRSPSCIIVGHDSLVGNTLPMRILDRTAQFHYFLVFHHHLGNRFFCCPAESWQLVLVLQFDVIDRRVQIDCQGFSNQLDFVSIQAIALDIQQLDCFVVLQSICQLLSLGLLEIAVAQLQSLAVCVGVDRLHQFGCDARFYMWQRHGGIREVQSVQRWVVEVHSVDHPVHPVHGLFSLNARVGRQVFDTCTIFQNLDEGCVLVDLRLLGLHRSALTSHFLCKFDVLGIHFHRCACRCQCRSFPGCFCRNCFHWCCWCWCWCCRLRFRWFRNLKLEFRGCLTSRVLGCDGVLRHVRWLCGSATDDAGVLIESHASRERLVDGVLGPQTLADRWLPIH